MTDAYEERNNWFTGTIHKITVGVNPIQVVWYSLNMLRCTELRSCR